MRSVRWSRPAWPRMIAAASVALFVCAPIYAQTSLSSAGGGGPRIINSDMAVLEAQEVRKDIPCNVDPVKPSLGFDLRFHSGFNVTLPMKELAGEENLLTILFRVIPESRKDEPMYFVET